MTRFEDIATFSTSMICCMCVCVSRFWGVNFRTRAKLGARLQLLSPQRLVELEDVESHDHLTRKLVCGGQSKEAFFCIAWNSPAPHGIPFHVNLRGSIDM